MSETSVHILGLGASLPKKVLRNSDLEKMVATSDEWIQTRTGIKERRIAGKGETGSELGTVAAKEALLKANLKPTDIDLIIVGTVTADMIFPSTACLIQQKIGAVCPAFDLSAACSGFVYSLTVAAGFIKAGFYRKILVIGTEITSSFINWKDRSTCVLFGDGAGAAVVGADSNNNRRHQLLGSCLGADGSRSDILKVPAGGSAMPIDQAVLEKGLQYLQMNGSDVFKLAVRTMENVIYDVCRTAKISVDQIDCLIPHQANVRIVNAVADRTKIPRDKVFVNVDRYGNMSAASTIVALYEAVKLEKIQDGFIVVIVAFGGGLTWAGSAIRW